MAAANTRVTFNLDEKSLAMLEEMAREGRFDSLAEAIREALLIYHFFLKQAQESFTEITLHNPETGGIRSVAIPRLKELNTVE